MSQPQFKKALRAYRNLTAEEQAEFIRRISVPTDAIAINSDHVPFVRNNKLVLTEDQAAPLIAELNRRTTIIALTTEMPHAIDRRIAFINGAVVAGRGQALRDALFTPINANGEQFDRLGELISFYASAVSDWKKIDYDYPGLEYADEFQSILGPVISRYVNALQIFKETNDAGPLLELAQGNPMTEAMAQVRKTSAYGRPEYPETKLLRQMKTERMSKYAGQWVKMGRDIVDSLKRIDQPSDVERDTLTYFEPLSADRRKEILKNL